MADSGVQRVAHDLLGEPHIRGRRVSVRQVAALVEERDTEPETVADRFDLDVADVYHALAYYHDHPGEMQAVERERTDAIKAIDDEIERPDGVEPDVTDDA
ncbi:MAG: hypothetical protein J07HN6_00291 [Halonotius sp. J07HN6]|jgi:Protein of unknown function (DUF433).|nr:MAG: hypothetical protein J07HN6_00291 [Halonotius sp. J07HN6]ESS08424.1 MAG: hypothetical protein A07HN63_01927 [uncultured archaeon A07HN63]